MNTSNNNWAQIKVTVLIYTAYYSTLAGIFNFFFPKTYSIVFGLCPVILVQCCETNACSLGVQVLGGIVRECGGRFFLMFNTDPGYIRNFTRNS